MPDNFIGQEVVSGKFMTLEAVFSLLCRLCKKVAVLLCFPRQNTVKSRFC